jgi:hypothetical protein
MALRIALYQAQPSAGIMALSDQEVLHRLAEKLVSGSLILSANRSGGWPSAEVSSSAAGSAAAAAGAAAGAAAAIESAPVVNLNALPDPPAVPAILPVLEEVEIGGAEVLPEVDQTLAQIDVALGTMDQASASLQPAPSKLPLINEAMTKASQAVTQTLDAL